jgi:hypothetical protein
MWQLTFMAIVLALPSLWRLVAFLKHPPFDSGKIYFAAAFSALFFASAIFSREEITLKNIAATLVGATASLIIYLMGKNEN